MTAPRDLFDADDLDDLVVGFEQPAAWQRAQECPCRGARDGAADPTCAVCAGIGFTWAPAVEFKLTLTSFETSREYGQPGMYEKGDCMLVLPATQLNTSAAPYVRTPFEPYTLLGENDRVVALTGGQRQTSVIVKGKDKIPHVEQAEIIECYAVVDDDRVVYTLTTDFSMSGRNVVWVSGHGPPTGVKYALTYLSRPEWYAYRDLVVQRQHQTKNLPRRVHLKGAEAFWRGHGGEPLATP